MMPQSDAMVEQLYNLVNKQDGERMRLEVARVALLAAEYRAQQLKRQRMAKAIDHVQAGRKASTRASGSDRSDGAGGVMLPPARAQREEAQ